MLNKDQLKRLAKIDIEERDLTLERFGIGISSHQSSTQQARWLEIAGQCETLSEERKQIVALGRVKPVVSVTLPDAETSSMVSSLASDVLSISPVGCLT